MEVAGPFRQRAGGVDLGRRIGTTSFTLSPRCGGRASRTVLATTETTYVHVDPKTFTKRDIEPDMRAALEAGARGKATDHAGYLW